MISGDIQQLLGTDCINIGVLYITHLSHL